MSIQTEIDRIKGNIASAYTAASGKGATLPDVQNSANLAGCIDTITGGGEPVDKAKFGVTIDNVLGDVDENGIYRTSDKSGVFDASIIQYIHIENRGDSIWSYLFANNKNIKGTIDLSNFKGVDYTSTSLKGYANFLEYAFANSGIETIILPGAPDEKSGAVTMTGICSKCQSLRTIVFPVGFVGGGTNYSYAGCVLANAFEYCENIQTIVGLGNIVSLQQQSFSNAFRNAKNLPEEWRFDSLTTLASGAFYSTFVSATGAKRFYFPSLVDINTQAFGSMSTAYAFYKNTDVSEIHFRADMQATIEAITGYSTKWGATNAAIYFDL